MKVHLKFIGENKDIAQPESLAVLKERVLEGDRVAVYQNHALDSVDGGRLVFLIVGPTRTFQEPPARAPDSPDYGAGWRYLPVGFLNLQTNELELEQEGAADG